MISHTGKRTWIRRLSVIAGLAILFGSVWCLLIARRESASRRGSAPALAPAGPVAWWPGDGDGNDAVGANNGIVPTGVSFAQGKVGNAFSFEGVDDGRNRQGESFDAVRIPGFGLKLPTSEITIEFWQKVNGAQVQYSVSLSPYDFTHVCRCIAPYNDGKIYFDFGNNHTEGQLSYRPPVSILGKWQHFAFVASQTSNFMKIYRNGVLEAQKIGMTPFENINYDLLIVDSFAGLLDEVRIYNRALAPTEILSIYKANGSTTGETGSLATPHSRSAEYLPWRAYVSNCVETLIQYGTDRYGPVHTDMLMSIIDVQKRESPRKPLLLDGQIYDEERPQRRNPAGSNLWYDQATLRVMYRLSMLTGNPKYAEAADRYIEAVFKY